MSLRFSSKVTGGQWVWGGFFVVSSVFGGQSGVSAGFLRIWQHGATPSRGRHAWDLQISRPSLRFLDRSFDVSSFGYFCFLFGVACSEWDLDCQVFGGQSGVSAGFLRIWQHGATPSRGRHAWDLQSSRPSLLEERRWDRESGFLWKKTPPVSFIRREGVG